MSFSRLSIFATAVLGVAAIARVAGAAQLELRARCQPDGPVVTLGDVAAVVASDPEQVRALAAVELFPSPPPGERRFVRVRQIQDLLLSRGVNLVEHRFSGSSQVEVSTKAEFDQQDSLGHRPLSAEAAASPSELIVVATRALPRGAVIGPHDVHLERRSPDDGPTEGFRAVEQVLGQQTTRTIAAGKPLAATSVRPPILVRRGEVVTVFVRSPGIRVRSAARACDEGSLGDLIGVESFEDRKTFLARVSGVQEVEVYARALRSGPAAGDFTLSDGPAGH